MTAEWVKSMSVQDMAVGVWIVLVVVELGVRVHDDRLVQREIAIFLQGLFVVGEQRVVASVGRVEHTVTS